MADDLDKFVLQYSVDLKDSISRLEKLKEKMGKVKDEGKDAAGGLKDFAADATSELGKLVPGLDAVSKAVRGMGGEFAIAAAAIGALAIGVKSVIDLRNQFNAQRQAGMDVGVSGIRIENWQRQFSTSSGGYVSRDQALDGIKKFREMTRAAYTDPSRMGRENIIMRRLGVDVGSPGNPTGFNSQMSQLAAGLQGKSTADVQGLAQALGVSQDWLTTVQKLGPEIGHITALTADEVKKRQEAQDSLNRYNDSLGKMKNDLNELEMKIGQGLVPAFDTLIKTISGVVDVVNKVTSHPKDADLPVPAFGAMGTDGGKTQVGRWGKLGDWLGINGDSQAEKKKAVEDAAKAEQEKKQEAARADEMAKKEDDQAKQAQQVSDQFTLAINQFSSAVGDFAGTAPSIQQVLAAWAGGAGAAAGLPGSSNGAIPGSNAASGGARGLRNNNPGNLRYGAFAKAQGATGQDDKGFAVFPSMEAGAAAQATLLDKNYFGKGLNTPREIINKYAPSSENNVGAYLDYLNKRGFGADKPITDRAGFASAVMAYESGYKSNPNAKGWTRSNIQFNEVADGLASMLRVPTEQLLRGGVSQRDIAFAIGASKGQLEKEITTEQSGVSSLQGSTDPTSRLKLSGLQQKLRQSQMQLQNLNAYSDQIMARGNPNAPNLPTVDSQTFNFNIRSTDPKEVAKEVEAVLSAHYNDSIANFSTGRKS
jgi:hypothetical protein